MERRRSIPRHVADALLVANKHTCCMCRVLGKDVQIHHVDSDAGNNDPANLAVLCLDCHSRATGPAGLGRRLSRSALVIYKREWELDCGRSSATSVVRSLNTFVEPFRFDPHPFEPPQIPGFQTIEPDLFRRLLNSMPAVVTLKTKRGRVVWANHEFEKMTGTPLHDLVGKTGKQIFGRQYKSEALCSLGAPPAYKLERHHFSKDLADLVCTRFPVIDGRRGGIVGRIFPFNSGFRRY